MTTEIQLTDAASDFHEGQSCKLDLTKYSRTTNFLIWLLIFILIRMASS